MNSFQRACRSPLFPVFALVLCGAAAAVGCIAFPSAPKVWLALPALAALAALGCFFWARSSSRAALRRKHDEGNLVAPADIDHAGIAARILAGLGGRENILNADYCATRLRFQVKDSARVDDRAVKAAGAAGVIRPSKTTCQVIIGTQVQFVYEELKKLL